MYDTYPMIKMYVSQGPVQFRSLLLCFDICLRTPDSEDWNLMQSSEFCIFSMLVEYRPNWCSFDWWMIFSPAAHSSLTVKAISKLEKLFACIYIDPAASSLCRCKVFTESRINIHHPSYCAQHHRHPTLDPWDWSEQSIVCVNEVDRSQHLDI